MRKSLLSASLLIGLFILSASASPALAVPEWGITVENHNAYGAQRAECPGGHESLPGESDCGVDPLTGSGTTFAQESGSNEYKITVKNVGNESGGDRVASVGQTVMCAAGTWSNSPISFAYQWLRGGELITGATSSSYTIQAEDSGKAVQCRVTATNAGGSVMALASGQASNPATPILVTPVPAAALPTPPENGVGRPSGTANEAGKVLTCKAGEWLNENGEISAEAYTYVWFRNGVKIEETANSVSTSNTYTLTAENVATAAAFQCQVTGINAVGAVASASSPSRNTSAPAPVPEPTPPGAGTSTNRPLTSPLLSVVDSLPEGIVLAGSTKRGEAEGEGWTCQINDPRHVSCVQEGAMLLAPGSSYEPITLHVHVNEDAPVGTPPTGGVTNVAGVSGGGAATVSANDPTSVVAAVPFGINLFTTSVVEMLENPFTQADGHPFAASTVLAFNSTPDNEGRLDTARGGPKSVDVELPPGFVGNTLTMPQCPLSSFKVNQCPVSTAVGYTQLSPGSVAIAGGVPQLFESLTSENSSLVYSLAPSPGHPAEFGFYYAVATPLLLTAEIRSGLDYGVTLASDGIANNLKLVAAKFTFCASGATEVTSPLSYHCNPVIPTSTGFLTNPARCSTSAPETTVRATPWNEPGDEVSRSVPTGLDLAGTQPSETESFVTGCASPELAANFGGSSIALLPETTQADSPAGAGFDLKIPQTSEVGKLATPELRSTMVTLPNGMSVSPSAANGLEACSNAQFGLESHVEPAEPGSCPSSSQVGMVEVFTPLLSAAPKAEGVPKSGEKLTCTQGSWNGNPVFAYQWLRNGVAISGATGREYLVVVADEGESLQCQVTATNTVGASVAVSREAVVAPEPGIAPALLQSGIPALAGTAAPGNALTCSTGTWAGSPTFAYEWRRDGVPIIGAETAKYGLTAEDAGRAIQCEVTATNGGGSVIADSAAVVVSPVPSMLPPLLGAPVQGKVFLGTPECSPCSSQDAEEGRIFRLFLEVEDPTAGVIVKLSGNVSANSSTGQLTATFKENPQLPFEDLKLVLKGGQQAPLATPQECGQATTTSDLTPWSSEPGIHEAQGTPDAFPSSSFNVDWDGHGGACPLSVPFAPSFQAQTASSTAGAYTPFTVRFTREDREQDLSGVSVSTPPGLLGMISKVSQCGELQAEQGSCPESSRIGTTTVGAGPGSHPFYLSGPVYLTGPYKGAPFGLSIAVPAVAGPFNLGTVVVRAAINVNPSTAAITVTSDPLPQIVDGVPLRLRDVRVTIDRDEFMFNPTNCSAQAVGASITGAHVNNGEANKTSSVSSGFAVGGCSGLPFAPSFSVSTRGVTSKANGASLDVKVAQSHGEANIQKVDVQLPKALPSRLTTLQQACTEGQFAANPAGCPAASDVGIGVARTPVLNNPLVGPAYLVSHGGAAFPDLEIILQGEGITLVLDGGTDIKKGVTFSRFETVPDAPISSFELNLPEGPHSILAAPSGVCGTSLVMPTTITGQNGKQVIQTTKIAVSGCVAVRAKPLTRAQKLAKALKACKKKKNERKRAVCERQAHKKYGPVRKAKKSNRGGK
jgi:hypothetical protein